MKKLYNKLGLLLLRDVFVGLNTKTKSQEIIEKHILLLLYVFGSLSKIKLECLLFILSRVFPELDQALKEEQISFWFTNDEYLNRKTILEEEK
ncbi:MAG: hypothetical protein ACTSPP_11835 [Candidatus Heimdallarchaeaceae archaeon]